MAKDDESAGRSSAANQGQRMLVATGHSLARIAQVCGVSRTSVSQWKNGANVPTKKYRDALFAEYGIPIDAWDYGLGSGERIPRVVEAPNGRPPKNKERPPEIAPKKPAKASKSPRKARATGGRVSAAAGTQNTDAPYMAPEIPPYPEAPEGGSTLDNVRHSLACIRHDLDHRPMTAAARSKVRADETRTLALIAKLEAAEELSQDRYVREHPAWKELRAKILAALEPFPEACAAVLEAIKPEEAQS